MTNLRYIKILMLCCISASSIQAQFDYCSDTLYFCRYGTSVLEGNGDLIGPFQLSTYYHNDIEHEFDGANLSIFIVDYFYGSSMDSIRVEDLGAGTVCHVPFVLEKHSRDYFSHPDIECMQYNYSDPDIDFDYTVYHGRKYNFCVGDRVTYHLVNNSNDNYYPSPPDNLLTQDRINQSLGDIEKMDSFSMDVVYTKSGYELLELTTYNPSDCPFKMYYPVEVSDTTAPTIVYQDSLDLPTAICQGQSITLSTEEGNQMRWEVSNGMINYGTTFSFTLDVPGTYQIKVEDIAQCNCSQPIFIDLVVEASIAPAIICTGTLCDGGEVTYYADQECENYEWSVENGTIVGGGNIDQDYVTVLWTDATTGSITLGTPTCSSSMCPEVTISEIPIIDAEAPINGLDSVCTGEISYYSIPNYNGTTFLWEVSSGGYIFEGQYSNSVAVKWYPSTNRGEAIVSVSYDNCDINCQGYSEKIVTILPVFNIVLDQNEYCIDGQIELTNNIGDNVNYAIITPKGDTLTYENVDSVIFQPDTVGYYGFIAENLQGGLCNTEDQNATIVNYYPDPIVQLIGPQAICKSLNTNYSIASSHHNETVIWEVYDGELTTPLFTSTSKELDYQWTSDGPYQIVASVFNTYTNCMSESATFPLHSNHAISGRDSACLNSESWYEFNGNPVVSSKWVITPDEAGIILGISQNSVRIRWQQPGTHTISIDQCDKLTELDVYVEPEIEIIHQAPETICSGDSILTTFSTNPPSEFIVVRKWQQDTVANENSPSAYLYSGEYNIYTTTAIGCTKSEYIYIQNVSLPTAKISVNGSTKWCPPGSTRLEARFYSTNNTYQWYRNGIKLNGQTGRYLYTTQFGSYTLEVTNQYGCKATSPARILEECCDNESAPINDYSVDIEETIITCETRMFEVLPTFYSSTFRWTARKGLSLYNMGIGTDVTYTFPEAGTYYVYATGDTLCQDIDIKVCGIPTPTEVCEGGRIKVVIPVKADFEYTQICGTNRLRFTETSSKIWGTSGLKYDWDFGDPGSGSSNSSISRNPSHTYDSVGTYTVTLVITHSSGCTTTRTSTVYVREHPEVEIETNGSFCLDSYVRFFSIVEEGSGLTYSWNFGDAGSSSWNNTSKSKNPYHEFSSAGTYLVTLRVNDPSNCYDTKTISVTIVENDLSGNIETDKVYPKCPEEEVILTAPSAPFYNWSNGDSVQNTTVTTEGNYRVTISNEQGCRHVTDYHYVDNYVFQNIDLYARDYENSGSQAIHYDSIEICYGEKFDIEATFVAASKYTWSNSTEDGNKLKYANDLASLAPGRYEYFTTVTEIPRAYKIQIALQKAGYDLGPNGADGTLNVDTKQALIDFQTDNGLPIGFLDDATLTALEIYPCEVDAGPFVVIINPLPDEPIVDSDLATNCEGELSTMFVTNQNETQHYVWSTGVEGIEISAYAAGTYQVTTTDVNGCISSNQAIEIYDVPEVSAWMSGCREVCFPEEICIDLRPELTYTLFKDGQEVGNLNGGADDLAIEEVGEYQLMATNADGCSALSDYLVLTKTPDDHALSGIVYYDENENNLYDGMDVLLEGVPVYLLNPDSIIAETVTNTEGYYEFLGFEDYDLETVIDPSLIDYIVKGALDSVVIYETCVEEKLVDFPLTNNCLQVPMNIEKNVCTGETILIDGIEYGEYDTDTLIYYKAINCDSIVYLEILPFPIPEINLSTVATCAGEQVGRLDIDLVTGDSLLFSIDENQEMYSDTIIQDLSKGIHTLYVHTNEGCIYPHEFEILEMPVPTLELDIQSTCIGLAEGQAILSVTAEDSLYYTLDQGDTYTDQLTFDSLAAGVYEVWAIDSLGCIYEAPFEVVNFEEPSFVLSFSHSCEGEENGSVSITFSNDVGTEFKLDQDSAWIDAVNFEGLAAGQYTLYSQSEFGCLDSADFEITTIPTPFVDFIITEECESHTLGTIEVISDSLVLYSLDGIEFDSIAVFDSLEAGPYTIYIQDELLCIYEYFVEIPLLPSPEIVLIPSTTCLDESMGTVEIQDASTISFTYSMDDSLYTTELIYDQLPAGEYEIYVQNDIGCTYVYEFEIEETLPPVVSLSHDDSCPNDDTGIVYVTTSGEDNIVFVNNGEGNLEREFQDLAPGIYEVWVEDFLGCRTYAEIEILELPPLVVDMPVLDADCYKDELMILPTVESHEGAVSFLWADGSTADYFVATKPGLYSVTISDDCDMTIHDWDVVVRHTGTEDHLYAANIFTPNNDGINDCFNVIVDSDLILVDFHYIIFDRWGNKMFETTNTEDCWDGIYNGAPVEQGVYVVMSQATVLECDGNKKIKKVSDVTVIR